MDKAARHCETGLIAKLIVFLRESPYLDYPHYTESFNSHNSISPTRAI
jgi:hypothetical protein